MCTLRSHFAIFWGLYVARRKTHASLSHPGWGCRITVIPRQLQLMIRLYSSTMNLAAYRIFAKHSRQTRFVSTWQPHWPWWRMQWHTHHRIDCHTYWWLPQSQTASFPDVLFVKVEVDVAAVSSMKCPTPASLFKFIMFYSHIGWNLSIVPNAPYRDVMYSLKLQDVALFCGVKSMPTFKAFFNGQEVIY